MVCLKVGRLKTGTPARLNGKTIHWEKLAVQDGDNPPQPFSYLTEKIKTKGTLSPEPNNNWHFAPEEWVGPAIARDKELMFGK